MHRMIYFVALASLAAVVACDAASLTQGTEATSLADPTQSTVQPTVTAATCPLPARARAGDNWFAYSQSASDCELSLPPSCVASSGEPQRSASSAVIHASATASSRITCGKSVGTLYMRSAPDDGPFRLVSHALPTAPYNTIPGLEATRALGFQAVELDVRFTKDSVPVLLHDPEIDHASTGSGLISSMTYAQASAYDFGIKRGAAFAGTRIPRLSEVMAWAADKKFPLVILELKDPAPYSEIEAMKVIHSIATGSGAPQWWLASANPLDIRSSRQVDAHIPTVWYYTGTSSAMSAYMPEIARDLPDYVGINYYALDLDNLAAVMAATAKYGTKLIVVGATDDNPALDLQIAQGPAPMYYTPFPWARVDLP